MDWQGARLDQEIVFREVSFPGLREGRDLTDVQGGSIDFGAFTDLKVSGTFAYTGEEPPTSSMVRILYTFTDEQGERLVPPMAIATLLVEPSDASSAIMARMLPDGSAADGVLQTGQVRGLSVLSFAYGDKLGMPTTVPAESNALSVARAIAEGYGLTVESDRDSAYVLPGDRQFDKDDSPGKEMAELLNAAGFRSAMPTREGAVRFQDAALGTAPVFTFKADGRSIKYPGVKETRNWTGAFNCWKTYYADEEDSLYAEAEIVSGAPEATSNLCGRRKTETIDVDGLEGDGAAAKLSALMDAVERKALDNSGTYEYVKIVHPYLPLELFDCVRVEYPDRAWMGHVTGMRLALGPEMRCETELRMHVAGSARIRVTGRNLVTGEEAVREL